MNRIENGRIGSSVEDFLKEEGIFEELQAQALKEAAAWQAAHAVAAESSRGKPSEDA